MDTIVTIVSAILMLLLSALLGPRLIKEGLGLKEASWIMTVLALAVAALTSYIAHSPLLLLLNGTGTSGLEAFILDFVKSSIIDFILGLLVTCSVYLIDTIVTE